jgi:hypothetical protein
MFGLEVIRHRWFELGGGLVVGQPVHPKHRGRVIGWNHGKRHEGVYYGVHGDTGSRGSINDWQRAMGIDWTRSRKALADAIPPAYTEFIGVNAFYPSPAA